MDNDRALQVLNELRDLSSDDLRYMLLRESEEKKQLAEKVKSATPAINYWNQHVATGRLMGFKRASKKLNLQFPDGRNVGPNLLIDFLVDRGVLFRDSNGIQFKHSYAHYFGMREKSIQTGDVKDVTLVNPNGLIFIANLLVKHGCVPARTKQPRVAPNLPSLQDNENEAEGDGELWQN